jgi:flagellar hook protein FlgE
MRSFYQSISGMKAMSDGLSVTGNNIANSRTNGFKTRRADFEDLFYQSFSAASAPNNQYAGKNPIEIGNGVRMKSIVVDLSQGSVMSTGRATDVAISGEGYFVVGNSEGQQRKYTRDGAFDLSADFKLASSSGDYVLGWNINKASGKITTSGAVEPIKINLNEVSTPVESTRAKLEGNLNATEEIGKVIGTQIPTYDSLGTRIDIEMNYVKTATSPNQYIYMATPTDNFLPSASITDITFLPSLGNAQLLQKGAYDVTVTAGAPGTVDITVTQPDGTVLLTKNISDTDQKVILDDGTNEWFSIDYEAGSVGNTATFEVAEVGTLTFNSNGKISAMTGTGVNGEPILNYTSKATGSLMTVEIEMEGLTGLATENRVQMTETDGFPAAILKSFDIGSGGMVNGYFSDGSVLQIAQIAVATFSNSAGLQAEGQNYFVESSNSGFANVGVSGQGNAGQIIGGSLENSNVDIAKELTELMFYQKAYTANSKTIQVSNEVLNVAINLIR